MTMTIHLDEQDIKQIVADYLVKKGYDVTSDDVEISVGKKWEGYGMAEHEVCCFEKCTVTVRS